MACRPAAPGPECNTAHSGPAYSPSATFYQSRIFSELKCDWYGNAPVVASENGPSKLTTLSGWMSRLPE